MVEIRTLSIPDVLEITPVRHGDERGFFSEVWAKEEWAKAGIDFDFIQDNHSMSAEAGVLRGLHYQLPPVAQDKLIRVTRGTIFDVAVDIRKFSPTFGQWVGIELSAAKWNQLLVPRGFAHGFLTLEPNCEVQYKVSAPYSPTHERAIRFDDPEVAIDWPLGDLTLVMSDRDRNANGLNDVEVFA